MTSQKQILANRNNSKKSTGPKNTEKTKKNAIKFGIFSKEMVMDGFYGIENKKEFRNLVKEVNEEYSPKTFTERLLVEKIIDCVWRLKRIRIAETAIIKQKIEGLEEEIKDNLFSKDAENYLLTVETGIISTFDWIPEPFLIKFIRDLKKAIPKETNEEKLQEMRERLNFLNQCLKNKDKQIMDLVLLKEKESFIPNEVENLLSYETTIERQLYRAIASLRRLKGWD